MAHAEQVALALFADVGDQQQAGRGLRQPAGGLPGAGDGQQGGQAGAVIGDAGAAEAAVGIHRDIVFVARREHGIEVRGQRDVGRLAERSR